MHCNTPPRVCKTLLALAVGSAMMPHTTWALDLTQGPPGTKEPYVAPNVIVSIDDSGSMDWQINNTTSGDKNILAPNASGIWDTRAKRINVLKYALTQVFNDTSLLPDKKIRMAWQAMWNNGGSPGVGGAQFIGYDRLNRPQYSPAGATSVDSDTNGVNSMQVLQGTHRSDFLSFVSKLSPGNGTPTHRMFSQADTYMRRSLSVNGPWASVPGTTSGTYLGCRRNYHIMFTDGRWNGTATDVTDPNRRDNATNLSMPDGAVYGGSTAADQAKTALYRDSYAKTLADWAFYSWATPLQTSGLTGTVQPAADYRKAPAMENFGKDLKGKDAILDRYWNPRYNPATWPHMVTYTIGISNDATTWPYKPADVITPPTQQVPFGYDKSFLDLVTGNLTWPQLSDKDDSQNNNHALDLWHAALNGRGRFYAVMTGQDLEKAFREIIGQINTQTDPDLTSTATSGANNTRIDVGKFTGAYEPLNAWKGFITAETVQADGTTVIPTPSWGGKNTADKLDALTNLDSRLILSWSDQWNSSSYKGGVAFRWNDNGSSYLSTAQNALLGLNTNATGVTVATNGQNKLNYIRGDRTLEGSDSSGYTAAKPFRERKSRQGDIINSVIWYTGAPASNYALNGYAAFTRNNVSRTAMIYAGGNDGMLHGFSAVDGSEKIAYVPRGVIPTLNLLTAPAFNSTHKYFVDGSPMTGDVDLGTGNQTDPTYTPDWHTLLVGTLGAGGKGYFVLDVTNPSSFTEGNAQQLVKLDRTRGSTEATPDCAQAGTNTAACSSAIEEDKDIGHITARPVLDESNLMRTTQIARMNNNRWAVVMGNGYNSTNQRPVLLIQYLDGARELLRIPATSDTAGTGKAADNGLSAPRLVDINGDDRPDIVYAGDNLGNMWKFDLTSANQDNWTVAFNGQPLFTAKGPTALNAATRPNIQPITAVPTVRANDRRMIVGSGTSARSVSVGGMMVAFGTGRNVTQDDPNSVQVQSLYSVLDNTRYSIVDTSIGKRLQVNPGDSSCTIPTNGCIPAPRALGEGVVTAKLAEQKISEIGNGDFATVAAKDAANTLNKDTWANFNGWYMDLPAVGERLLKPMEFYDGSNLLAVYSQVPAKGSNVDVNVESCNSTSVDEERQYRTLINIMDGLRPSVQIVDMNGDGLYNGSDLFVSRVRVSKGSHTLITQKNKVTDIDTKNNKELLARMPEQSLRPSWRQLK